MVYIKGLLSFVVLLQVVGAREYLVCPSRQITASSGEVISQRERKFTNGINCALTITSDPGMVFNVVLTKLSIDESPDFPGNMTACDVNALVIDTGDKQYQRCSKSDKRQEFRTISNRLVIRFRTGNKLPISKYDHAEGFKLSFQSALLTGESICPPRHIRKKRSGTIFSPGFPRNYGNNQNCRITIPIPDNFQLNVWLSDFSLQRTPNCERDSLVMKDEHGGVKLCGEGTNKLPGITQFTGSLAKFRFISDSSIVKSGFRLHYNMTRLTQGRCMCSTGSSYMCITNFNRKVRKVWHRIKFYIKTTQNSGLLIYSHKGNYRDYMYIAIQDGKLHYKSDLGTGPSMAVSHGFLINDNKWHYVEIRRRKRLLMISVDNETAVAGSAKTKGRFNRIDLENSTGYVLGTPPQLQGMPNFIGCIKDFTIDGREPLVNSYVDKPDYHGHGIKGMRKCE